VGAVGGHGLKEASMTRRFVPVLALLSLALLVQSTAAQPPRKLVFALNWFAVGDHAAYWVALDKGYYKARGLDVELQNSKGSGDSIAKVDTGRADLGLADAVVVIPRIAQGARIKIVGAVFDNTPLNIWTRKDTGISRPKDLEGKLLAAPPGDSQRQLFPAFAKVNGLDASKVRWLNIEPAAKFVALAEKRADAVPDYTTGQPFWEKAVGKDNLVRMPWHQYGFDTYSMSIMAGEKILAEHAQTVRDFLAASYMGWRDVMEDPKAALQIFKKRVPDIDLALIEPNMMLGLELMRTERYARNGIGWMDRGKMCRTVEFINTYMPDMPRKVGCDEVFTNELLTKIQPPAK
jgi:NitT/TauT family transport system substrate-binding protein